MHSGNVIAWYEMLTADLQHTWMAFVDGENLTMRAQALSQTNKLELAEGPYFKQNCFVWIPGWHAQARRGAANPPIQQWAVRAHYYSSFVGDDTVREEVRDLLRTLHFYPRVFKKAKQDQKAKGVDIALTKDVLSHAFLGNYQTAVLIAGDGDYVPLIEEVQRLGRRVIVWFFRENGLSPELLRVADDFYDLTGSFLNTWRNRPVIPTTSLT